MRFSLILTGDKMKGDDAVSPTQGDDDVYILRHELDSLKRARQRGWNVCRGFMAGAAAAATVLQSTPLSEDSRMPEANNTMLSTFYARVAVSWGDISPDVPGATPGDVSRYRKPHIERFEYPLDGRLGVPGIAAPVPFLCSCIRRQGPPPTQRECMSECSSNARKTRSHSLT